MVEIQSKEVIDKIADELKIQPSMNVPREVENKINLSYNVNPPRTTIIKSGNAFDSTGGTIFATSTQKRTFLLGVSLAISKDIVSDSIFTRVLVDLAETNANEAIFYVRYEPLTAGQLNESIIFPYPIELKKGSNVTLGNSTATSSIDVNATFYLYETDPQ